MSNPVHRRTPGLLESGRDPSRADAAPTRLAAVLDRQGRRLVWVADRLGVDSSTVSRWRSGDRTIPARRLRELAALLEVQEAELVDRGSGRSDA